MKIRLLSPIVKKEIIIKSRSITLPALVTIVDSLLCLIALLGTFGVISSMRQTFSADFRPLLYIYILVVVSGELLISGICPFMTAGQISSERESGTMDLILATRLTPLEIVAEKIVSAFIQAFMLTVSCLPFMMIPLICGGIGMHRAVIMIVVMIPELWFMLCVGLYASSCFSRVNHSAAAAVGLTAATIGGTILLSALCAPFCSEGHNYAAYLMTLNPLLPVFHTAAVQIGDTSIVYELFGRLNLVPDSGYISYLTQICMLTELSAGAALAVMAMINVAPGRRNFLKIHHG